MGNKGEITRELLITEAAKLFHKKGFRGTSISDLTAATGVKKGSLYFHFLSKDDLGLAVLEWSREKWLEFSKIALSGITPGDCLLNFFNTVVSYHRDLGFIGGCIFGNTALEMSDSDQRYVKFIDQFFSDMADMWSLLPATSPRSRAPNWPCGATKNDCRSPWSQPVRASSTTPCH